MMQNQAKERAGNGSYQVSQSGQEMRGTYPSADGVGEPVAEHYLRAGAGRHLRNASLSHLRSSQSTDKYLDDDF